MAHIIVIFLLFCVLTAISTSEMHAKLVVCNTASYTRSSPIVGLVSRYHVIQVKSDNGKGVYYLPGDKLRISNVPLTSLLGIQVELSPPQTPHASTRNLDPIFLSQPTD